jgi:hypothetical protein
MAKDKTNVPNLIKNPLGFIVIVVVFVIAVFLFWWLSGGGIWLIDAYL